MDDLVLNDPVLSASIPSNAYGSGYLRLTKAGEIGFTRDGKRGVQRSFSGSSFPGSWRTLLSKVTAEELTAEEAVSNEALNVYPGIRGLRKRPAIKIMYDSEAYAIVIQQKTRNSRSDILMAKGCEAPFTHWLLCWSRWRS